MKDVFKKLSNIDAGKVLDAATGKGEFISLIKQIFRSYTSIIGIDVSEKSVQYAQKVFPENDIEIFKMDVTDMDFEDSYFDTVCISNSLHHMPDANKVIMELLRVLKPGGMLLVTEMYKDGSQTEAQKTHILMHHWISKIDRLSNIPHFETFTKQYLVDLVNPIYYQDLQIEDYYQPVDNPKEQKNCDSLLKNCLDTMKRLEGMGNHSELISEGKSLIQRIHEIGCATANRLLITAIKK